MSEDVSDMLIHIPEVPRVEDDPIWYMRMNRRPQPFSEQDMRQMAYRIQSFQRAGGRLGVQEDVLDYIRSLSKNNVAPFIRAWAVLRDGMVAFGDLAAVAQGLPTRHPWRPVRGKEVKLPRWEPHVQVCRALAVTLSWIPPKVLTDARWIHLIPARDLRTFIPGAISAYRLDVSRVAGVHRLYPNPTDAQVAALVTLATAAGGRGGGAVLDDGSLSAIEDLQRLAPRTPLVPVRPFGLIGVTATRLKEAAATVGWTL